jgi:hypothetical protein
MKGIIGITVKAGHLIVIVGDVPYIRPWIAIRVGCNFEKPICNNYF